MARILRGDIVWAELSPTIGHEQAGRRPVLVLSRERFNERSGTVIAVALTSQTPRAGFPFSIEIESKKLPRRTWAKIGQIRTLSVTRLGNWIDRLDPKLADKVVEGLNEIISDPR